MSDNNGMYCERDTFTEADRASLRDLNTARGERARTVREVMAIADGMIVESREQRELFTFEAPVIGVFRFDVRGIKNALARGDIPALMFRLDPIQEHFYRHVLNNNGVEPERLVKLAPKDLERPGIMVAWPNGYHTMIDGNHRLCRRFDLGLLTFRFLMVNVLDCTRFMCRPGDEEKLFARERSPNVTTLHVEIKEADKQ